LQEPIRGNKYFKTEYDRGDWFNTAWLMHNCLVYGNVSAYLWWELVWGSGGKPFIEMQYNTYSISNIIGRSGNIQKFISSDWKRVTADVDTSILRVSAFTNPDGNKLTVVVLNVKSQPQSMNFDIQDFNIDSGTVIRTSETGIGLYSKY